jgi:hypothetical protein
MRRLILVGGILALGALGFGLYQASDAITHPVSCPGAFYGFGCPASHEQTSYVTANWTMVGLMILAILPVTRLGRIRSQLWRGLTLATFILAVLLFPLPVGVVASFFLSAVAPGTGVLVLFGIQALILLELFTFASVWPVGVAPAPPAANPAPPTPV